MLARDARESTSSSQRSDLGSSAARKRKRLTHACNRCRSKKVRCDELLPDCSNCVNAGARCITQDPHRPDVPVLRREAQKPLPDARGTHQLSHLTPEYSVSSVSPISQSTSDNHIQFDPQSQPRTRQRDRSSSQTGNRLPAIPRFAAGNSLTILTQWLDLAFARIGHPQRFSSKYKETYAASERRLLEISLSSPEGILEKFPDRTTLLYRFLSTVNLVFPILGPTFEPSQLDEATYFAAVISGSDPQLNNVVHCLLLAASASSDKESEVLTCQTLSYVLANLGMIVTSESLQAVTIFLLSAIIFRYRNQAGVAWHMLSMGVSTALTLGLNRSSFRRRRHESATTSIEQQQYPRIWWSLYVLDRTLSIELERPGLIREYDCVHKDALLIFEGLDEGVNAFAQGHRRIFEAIIDLARLQGKVNERLLMSRHLEEVGKLSLKEVIAEKIRTVGELDLMMLEWVEKLPYDIRPSEHSFCEPAVFAGASFLATQFYQTLFILHRNALLINNSTMIAEVSESFPTAPYRLRLLNGQNICCSTARSLVGILNKIDERGEPSVLVSIHAPLVAICALAIKITRSPGIGTAKADLELQANAIRIISKQNSQPNSSARPDAFSPQFHDTGLEDLLNTLHAEVSSRVQNIGSSHSSSRPTSAVGARLGTSTSLSMELGPGLGRPVSNYQENTPYQDFGVGSNMEGSSMIMHGQGHEQSNRWSVIGDLEAGFFGDSWGDDDTGNINWDLLAVTLDLPSV